MIPVFFTIDDRFAPFCNAAIASLADHADNTRNYRIIILYQDLSFTHRAQISAFSKDNVEIQFRPMTENLSLITDRMGNRLRADFFTLTIFYRLFLPRLFPEYDKGIYLDSDIILTTDIARMYDVDLRGKLLGAVADSSVEDEPVLVDYIEHAIGVDRKEYVNSGVLLLDMKGLRRHRLAETFLHFFETYQFDCIAPDQDYLNALCNGRILYLDPRWDTMPVKGKMPIADPWLVHYNLYEKPWHYENVPYEQYFWKYARKCACYPEIQEIKHSFTENEKALDEEHMHLMCQRAFAIRHSPLTFRKVFGEEKKERL